MMYMNHFPLSPSFFFFLNLQCSNFLLIYILVTTTCKLPHKGVYTVIKPSPRA